MTSDRLDPSARGHQRLAVLGLIGLIAIVTVVIALQRPFEWRTTVAALGFLIFTCAWAGMFFSLRRELPDHPLARAKYVRFRYGYLGRWEGTRLLFRLVAFHFERHRFDLWSLAMVAGLLMIGAAFLL